MADQQQPQEQAAQAPQPEVKTTGDKSREERDASFAQRQAKAAARTGKEPPKEKLAPAADDQPTSTPEPEKKEPDPEAKKASDVDKRHAIAERRERRVAAKEAKLTTRETAVARAEASLQSRFGDPEAAAKEYDAKNYHAAAKYIQYIFKDDFATITQKIARATAGLSPEKLKELEERDNFTKEKREFEAQKKREQEAREQGATRETAVKNVAAKLTGHDVLKLKNGPELVLQELERAWDPSAKAFRITFKQAGDAVVASKLAEAEALGLKKPVAKLADPPPKPETKPAPAASKERSERKPAPEPRTSGKSFEERHAAAARIIAKRRG